VLASDIRAYVCNDQCVGYPCGYTPGNSIWLPPAMAGFVGIVPSST
jgi:hypothetical protein